VFLAEPQTVAGDVSKFVGGAQSVERGDCRSAELKKCRAALTRGVAARRWQTSDNLLKQGDLPWINFVTGIKKYDSIAYEYNPCPP
jgi:hypothetical protein